MEQRSSVRKEVLVEHILLNCIFISDVYVIYIFLFFFHCLLCYFLRAHFPVLLFARAYIIVLYSDVGRILYING